jgi:phospholipase/carboxylesterase
MRGTKPKPDRIAASRLTSRPVQVNEDQLLKPAPLGLQELKLERERDGYIYVPAGYSAPHPAPLILVLHGAGGNARQSIPLLQPFADRSGMILLAPDSRQPTWDVIVDGYGPDVAFIDRALEQTFSRYAVDPTHVGIGGFSDGASYALSLGITNGDLFTHVLAFSPGFMAPAGQHGAPALFISHGTQDQVLPIDVCSRRLVPRLERAGYSVDYREFAGPHTVPPEIARTAVDWFLKARS